MKNLKSKLLASVAMLLVSTVMLTSASFAWFTISTAPEIKGISTKVTANGNLEIALSYATGNAPAISTTSDSGKNETWGNLVDLTSYFTGTAGSAIVLKPVEVSTTGAVKIPTWGTDGRISATAAATGTSVGVDDLNGIYTYAKDGKVYAIRVDFWLRSNEAGKISLSGEEADRGNGQMGGGSTMTGDMADKVTVAFQVGDGNLQKASLTGGKLSANDICTLTANEAQLVKMYIYLDGAVLTNADMMNTETALNINVQFDHAADLTAMTP